LKNNEVISKDLKDKDKQATALAAPQSESSGDCTSGRVISSEWRSEFGCRVAASLQTIFFKGVNTEGPGLALTLLRLKHIVILVTGQDFCTSALHLRERYPSQGKQSQPNYHILCSN
jgi:hypothetical protein